MKIFFGADYYPEHWHESRWETDAVLMEEMGIDVVRMAEFSWHKMEPREGEYHFEWLDKAIQILAAHKVSVVLGTPTAAPPAWMIEKTPEILPVDSKGIRKGFGGRHHDCQSNPVYREHIRKFVTAMAEHFKDNENVIGWQTDNELGNSHADLCMCDSCRAHFQDWLEKKYGDIDTLNTAWGNQFWSQEYNSFRQIPAPRETAAGHNPSALLDWKRFCSDLIVDFQQLQIDIIREHCPGKFITHNCMGFSDKVSYYDLGKNLDFVSHDQYPGGYFVEEPYQYAADLAAPLDFIRGVKNKNFWIMEQQSGITGWDLMGRAPKPGQLAMWSMQGIAHGADTIVYFRWRTCSFGTEQYWHGILPHSGKPGKRYAELKAFIADMRPHLGDIQGSMPENETAIVYSYDQNYAMTIQPQNKDLSYVDQVHRYYRALHKQNIPVDFVQDTADLSNYKLVVAPLQYIMRPALEDKYREYVENGGTLVLTMRTGVKDETNICMTDMELPGRLGGLAGIEIPDYDCLRSCEIQVQWGSESYKGRKWADEIAPATAETVAHYTSEYKTGTPAVTVNHTGKGLTYYVGTEPDEALMDRLIQELSEKAGVSAIPCAVEVVRRKSGNKVYIFAMNHSSSAQCIPAEKNWQLLCGENRDMVQGFGYNLYVENI